MNLMINFCARTQADAHRLTPQDFEDLFRRFTRVRSLEIHHDHHDIWSGVVRIAESRSGAQVVQRYLNNCYWKGGCLNIYLPLFFQDGPTPPPN